MCATALTLTTVEPSDTLTDVVKRRLAQVMWAGSDVRYVLLDRTFYAVGVGNALSKQHRRFIVPMMCRGKGGRKFFRRGWFDHTFRSHNHEATATVRVAVMPDPDGNCPRVVACSA